MTKYIDITQEIKSALQGTIGENILPEIEQLAAQNKGGLKTILALCNVFMSQINEEASVARNSYGVLYATNATKKKTSKYTWAQLMEYGAKIIYLIRTFFTNEEISFLFGVSTKDGETKTVMLSQDQVLTNFKKVSRNAIGIKLNELDVKLKSLNNLMTSEKVLRKNQWALVQSLATPAVHNTKTADKVQVGVTKEGRAHYAYQSQKMDNQVYVKYSGKHQTLYYNTTDSQAQSSSDLYFFNFGWLWEWYNSILLGQDDTLYQLVASDLVIGRIRNIILSRDRVAGTKQGDFVDAKQRQIQAKFNNERIITFNNIKVIMIQLTQALNNYANAPSKETQEEIMKVLQQHFFSEGALMGENYCNRVLERDILSKLESSLT